MAFQVWVWSDRWSEAQSGGTQLFDSGLVTGSTATRAVNVDVTGKNELRLVVADGSNGIDFDHADWA